MVFTRIWQRFFNHSNSIFAVKCVKNLFSLKISGNFSINSGMNLEIPCSRIHCYGKRGILLILFCFAINCFCIAPYESELECSRLFAVAKFEGKQIERSKTPGLYIHANHDPVIKNERAGRPLNIAGILYTNGLYCHAFSKISVKLPSPGESFSAIVGVDSNEQTSGGRGSVIFSVIVGGREKFNSGVMREGMPGKPVSVSLDGADEFILQIDPTPDGISCDQSDWAEAKVKLKDGSEIWLSNLPFKDLDNSFLLNKLPFSFIYGGKNSDEILHGWKIDKVKTKISDRRESYKITWKNETSGVEVRLEAIQYEDYPVVEWLLYIKNAGTDESLIFENIKVLDLEISGGPNGRFLLHHNTGSPADGNDYKPHETLLKPGGKKRLAGGNGRSTNVDWSYFNLEKRPDEGIIFAIGWPGQWFADLECNEGNVLKIIAGQERTRFKLFPGEEIRTPLIVMLFWEGEWIRGQNLWRKWMMAHSMPKPGGSLPRPQFVASSSRQYDEMVKANETNQIMFINRYLEENLKLDYWWMDAGWYDHHGGGWPRVGTWLVDSNRFPRGLKAVSDYAHSNGIKTIVWFEPERVAAGTWLAKNHPEWILGGEKGGILNLGNPEAWEWLVNHIDRTIVEQGIDLYRQDFNIDPLKFWQANDPPDRQGITEIKYVMGLLSFWDELRRRHPNLLIDACASGGRRNDIEIMRRAVPLWRSDYAYEPVGHQCMTYGISMWLPYHGTGTVACRNATYYGSGKTPVEPYAFWSNVSPSLGFGIDIRVRDLDYNTLRRLVNQWRLIITNYFGDFYPLTAWTRDNTHWIAWQFDRPENKSGLVQVFRRENSPYESINLKLREFKDGCKYRFENIDDPGNSFILSGGEVIKNGITVRIPQQPGCVNLVYTRMD